MLYTIELAIENINQLEFAIFFFARTFFAEKPLSGN